ncbi:DNA polymerase III subunit gamma/tau [Mycoplasmopsis cricetuli]|uniref:DNA polymerase III subunit gamma/tau n=1 Tax=Mycoplasmopsis cricetuli TaxID=171283 RepID=UPI000470E6A7|nr:DNA polymerase III subunit gamma/tau [Mycoplasmopsis cricetuli]
MSYKTLYRKYRPTSFDEIVGQDHIINTLKNIIKTQKIGHAYLFSGPKGSGKTSLANIFANILNCFHNEDPTKACYNCKQQIGKSLDIIEMDAASNNGVNEIRELKEKIEQSPINSRFKIYIIDEVHMLSNSAFNALLKTLEEPPLHAIFIFATTDHQKIPLTVMSRLQRFNFRRLSITEITNHLKYVLSKEQIKFSLEALKIIARLSSGGMRDALSIAEQSSSFGNGEINVDDLMTNFGIISNKLVIEIINYLYHSDIEKTIKLFTKLINYGIDATQFVLSLISIVKETWLYYLTKNEKFLEWVSLEEIQNLTNDSKFFNFVLNELNDILPKLKRSEHAFELLELFFLKICSEKMDKKNILLNSHKNQQLNNIEASLDIKKKNEINSNLTKEKEFVPDHDFGIENIIKSEKENINQSFDFFAMNEATLREYEVKSNLDKTSNSTFEKNDEIEQKINQNNEFIIDSNEKNNSKLDVSNDIIDNQEISTEDKLIYTQEIDLEKTMVLNDYNENLYQNQWNKQDIANLLHILRLKIQSNIKDNLQDYKELSEITINKSKPELFQYMSMLKNTKILAGSNTFIVLTSDDENLLSNIFKIRNTEKFQKYINFVFKGYKHIYLLSPNLRKSSYALYKEQTINNQIPNNLVAIPPLTRLENRFEDETIESKAKILFGPAMKIIKRGK